MPEFKPFSLGDSLAQGQNVAMNQFRLGEAARGVQARQGLSQALQSGTPEAMQQYQTQFPTEAREYQQSELDLQTKKLQSALAESSLIEYLARGVTDEQSYKTALGFYKEKTGKDIPDAPPSYDQGGKEYIEQAMQQSLSLKDRINIELQKLKLNETDSGRGEYSIPYESSTHGLIFADTRRKKFYDSEGNEIKDKVIGARYDPRLQGELTGTKKQSEESAKLYNETVENSLKISDQVEAANEGIQKLINYSKGTLGGTGPFATVGGLKRYTDAELQDMEAVFNKINLKNLVTTFQGFSRSIDTNVEREAWNRTQPNIKLDDPVNMNILIGNVSLGVKASAEGEARRQYIENSPTKSLAGYRSPVIGRTKTMFDQNGKAQLVRNEEVNEFKKQGFMDASQYAKTLMRQGKKTQSAPVAPAQASPAKVKFLGFEE